MRILLVEDDHKLTTLIQDFLEKDSYAVDSAASVEQANSKIETSDSFDLVILDLLLPDGDGASLCADLRKREISTPILMLTSKTSVADKVLGLDAGADDYLPKPFNPGELKARIRALTRRPRTRLGEILSVGTLKLNTIAHSVKVGEQNVELMPKEYALLEYLMRNKNQVVKKDELLRNVWGIYSRNSSNRLEVYIRYLREKLDLAFDTKFIHTVRGSGYRIADDS
jgi:DNA-binding response OmpR family regulator